MGYLRERKRAFDVSLTRRFRVRIIAGILVTITFGGSFYSFSHVTKADAINSTDFVTTWKTDNSGASNSTSILIPTDWGRSYDYSVDWNNDGIMDETNITGDVIHDFGSPGTYTIRISGTFPAIYFQGSGDANKILAVNQWGTIHWETMQRAFQGATNLTIPATDTPDLSGVTDMSWMFYAASSMNQSVANWDVSNVTNVSNMFADATAFNQPLDSWDTSNITDMSYMLSGAISFNQPVGSWDVSHVTNMSYLFGGLYEAAFNQPLNTWDTSSVVDMSGVFAGLVNFNQPLDSWDTSNVTNMSWMFNNAASFDQPLSTWDTTKVTNMSSMFFGASAFNQPLNAWNTSNVTDMGYMFCSFGMQMSFNQPLSNWDTSKVTNMSYMFRHGVFDQPLNVWDTSNVQYMSNMFQGTGFNQPLDNWDTGKVMYMDYMFQGASSFDQPIGNWNTASVITMNYMFQGASSFKQPLGSWNTMNVTNMGHMFEYANSFNQPLDGWNTSKVTNMSYMFALYGWEATGFNQPLDNWDTSKVTNMSYMFNKSTHFNQSLATWNIATVTNMSSMLTSSGLSTANYDATLLAWAGQSLKANVALGATGLEYCTAQSARQGIITNHTWTISGDSLQCTPPSSPQNPSVTVSQGTFNFTWQAPLTYGAGTFIGYTPQYKLATASVWTSEPSTTQLSTSILGLDPGVQYDFRVVAVSTHGSSTSSSVVSATSAEPITKTFDVAGVGSVFDDAVAKSVLSVTSAACYTVQVPSVSVLGSSGVAAPEGITILGGLAYSISCTTNGGTTTASIDLGRYYSDISKLKVYKKSTSTGLEDITNQVSVVNSVKGSTNVTTIDYTLVDGGVFDEDNTVNGTIVDPVYVGVVAQGASGQASGSTLASTGQNREFGIDLALMAIIGALWFVYRKAV